MRMKHFFSKISFVSSGSSTTEMWCGGQLSLIPTGVHILHFLQTGLELHQNRCLYVRVAMCMQWFTFKYNFPFWYLTGSLVIFPRTVQDNCHQSFTDGQKTFALCLVLAVSNAKQMISFTIVDDLQLQNSSLRVSLIFAALSLVFPARLVFLAKFLHHSKRPPNFGYHKFVQEQWFT